MKRVLVAAVGGVLLLSGCGKPGATVYSRTATADCLTKAGFRPRPVTSTTDFVANSATGGAFRVNLADNHVTLSFGQTLVDADNLDQAYRRFRASNVGIDDVLRRQGNAVMLWHVHPADADLSTIANCLKS